MSQIPRSCVPTLISGQAAPVTGIAYCLIILRFALGGAVKQSRTSSTGEASGSSALPGRNGTRDGILMSPIMINMAHKKLSDNDLSVNEAHSDLFRNMKVDGRDNIQGDRVEV